MKHMLSELSFFFPLEFQRTYDLVLKFCLWKCMQFEFIKVQLFKLCCFSLNQIQFHKNKSTITLLSIGYLHVVFSEETQDSHTDQYSGMLVCVHEFTYRLSSGQRTLEDDFGLRESAFKQFICISKCTNIFITMVSSQRSSKVLRDEISNQDLIGYPQQLSFCNCLCMNLASMRQ